MLNESDMQKYHIGSESDCAKISTRKAIRSLLECARDKIGFNTDGEEIFVQLYTSKKGGCELFVTKCASEISQNEISAPIKSHILSDGCSLEKEYEKKPPFPSLPPKSKPVSDTSKHDNITLPQAREKQGSRIAFSFANLSDLIAVCRILKSCNTKTESQAFSDNFGNFYLLLPSSGMSAYSRLDKLTFITEYGKRENPDCLLTYVSEHGKTICSENAIETLSHF